MFLEVTIQVTSVNPHRDVREFILPFTGNVNDLHIYDIESGHWSDLSVAIKGNPPSPRYRHRMISIENKLYVFGGFRYGSSGGSMALHLLIISYITCWAHGN